VEPPGPGGEELAFDIREGLIHNHFYRRGPVAAHLLVSSGPAPRIVTAFPAGNTGAGIWFEPADRHIAAAVEGPLVPVSESGGLHGVAAEIALDSGELVVAQVVLGSVRHLRDYNGQHTLPEAMQNELSAGPPFVVRRSTFDGKHRVELRLEPLDDTEVTTSGDSVLLRSRSGGERLRLRMTALTDEPPLTPISDELFAAAASDSQRERQVFAFLAYQEKLLAGSWQYLTYFGRDTLLTLRLIMPAVRGAVVESGIGSVIERLARGEVAHEEEIGDFAAFRHRELADGARDGHQPLFDYQMIDDDFLLAPVVAQYFLQHPEGRQRSRELLLRKTAAGATYGAALRENLEYVLSRASAFASRPAVQHLVQLKAGRPVGEWRDSREGLGGGRVPYSVNAALVPAALEAIIELEPFAEIGIDAAMAARARSYLERWNQAGQYFEVRMPRDAAQGTLRAYAAELGAELDPGLSSLRGDRVMFPAVALDRAFRPVPVMNSDVGFVLEFRRPSQEFLRAVVPVLLAPFPVGLRTPVGMVVASPAYADDPALRAQFTRNHYHGTVVWSWQQALLASGLRRQLARDDLDPETRSALVGAEAELWRVIAATDQFRTSELWSWDLRDGQFHPVPFGQEAAHITESNAAQLWSTVFLGVRPPASGTPPAR
jgi:hypothetical protein